MLARYLLKVPGAAAATPEELIQAVGPTVQRYLTGTLAPTQARPRETAVKTAGGTV
jgi:hypothetical protein